MSTMESKHASTDGAFIPLSPSSDDDEKQRSPIGTARPTILQEMYGRLTEAPGRLTPTGQGRIKAPPNCCVPALKKEASTINEFTEEGVCFSPEEAATCASNSLLGGNLAGDDAPFNMETCDADFTWSKSLPSNGATTNIKAPGAVTEAKTYVSSNVTVVTNSSGSCCLGSGDRMVKNYPPLVVRTDSLNSKKEKVGGSVEQVTTAETKVPSPSLSLPSSFADKLVKGNNSRTGRSLQRWLVHSKTEELVRQVAGCIPITRDGRVILVSASRKAEWILPKGGWDSDEAKRECANRETYEEAGVLGSLGACLDPIDYETSKSKKRRFVKELGLAVSAGSKEKEGRPPLPKRVKTEAKPSAGKIYPSQLFSSLGHEPSYSKYEGVSNPKSSSSGAALMDPPTSPSPESCNFNRLFLFPLYVSEVKSEWPEKGRLRKLVDIDEAIEIMEKENRLYFRAGLLHVKARGLHLFNPTGDVTAISS